MIKWNLYDQEFKKGFLSSLDTTKFIQIKLNQKKKKKTSIHVRSSWLYL